MVLDGDRFPEWYAGVQTADADESYPEPGGAVNLTYKAAGVAFQLTMTSLRIVRGESLLLRMDGMITGKSRWTYSPTDHGTQVHCRFEYEMPGGGAGKALDKLVVVRMNASNLEKSLSNLKALLENQ